MPNFTQRMILYTLVAIAGFVWLTLSKDSSASTQVAAPQVGFIAPDFTLKTPGGESYTLSKLKGKAVLVNLWATWCPPCRAEMPAMQRIYDEYKDRGLIVLGLNMTAQDNPLEIAPFLQKFSLTFPVLLDETGEVGKAYQLRSLPSSYFINREGLISEVVIGGPMAEALLRTRVEEILK
ncbi:MAG: TlpA family protein disulfide reductase [Anaerolineales bacterium]|nr:TlpA family protein disulfide reductase [Anaerolineales bacterium]